MKTATRTILLSTIAAFASASGAAIASQSPGHAPAGIVAARGLGTVTVTVLHARTLQPLMRMPVNVRLLASADGTPVIARTGRNGSVMISNLAQGRYEAFVSFNNRESDHVRFVVNKDHQSKLTLYFNPELD